MCWSDLLVYVVYDYKQPIPAHADIDHPMQPASEVPPLYGPLVGRVMQPGVPEPPAQSSKPDCTNGFGHEGEVGLEEEAVVVVAYETFP